MLSLGLKQAPYNLQITICTQHSGEEAKIKTINYHQKDIIPMMSRVIACHPNRPICMQITKKLMAWCIEWDEKNVYTTSITINTNLAEFSPCQ